MGVSTGFTIASSALSAFRVASQVAGHNMTNVNTEGYSRQRAHFASNQPQSLPFGSLGTGVDLKTISRIRDSYLDRQLNSENSELGAWEMRDDALSQLELYFNETSEAGMSYLMSDMFAAWQELSSNPDDQATRVGLVQKASLYTNAMNEQISKMRQLRQNMDEALSTKVEEVNSLTSEIASLNFQIVSSEADGHTANDLRDRRDLLVNEMSKLIDFDVYEQSDGAYALSIDNKNIVFSGTSIELETFSDPTDNPLYLLDVRWSDTKVALTPEEGEIGGILNARDVTIPKYEDLLDDVAHALVEQVNRIHASGQGTIKFTTVTGAESVDDPTNALSAAGLDFTPINGGTFDINVEGEGTTTFTVDTSWDLNTFAANLQTALDTTAGGASDLTVSVSSNKLDITSSGNEFTFANDNSDTLMALGINTFFTGYDALDITVNQRVVDNASLVAAAQSDSPGDNSNALAIAGLRNTPVLKSGTQTIEEYYNSNVIGELGSEASEAQRLVFNQKLVTDQIQDSIDEGSSVSIDEEMTKIIELQHATTAVARYITILGDMLNEVVNIVS